MQGDTVDLAEIELWPEPASGANVLDEMAETFSNYLALPDGAADALALWCAHSHVYDIFECSPRLNISSPDKQCGKTTCRDVVALLVPRPVLAENLTVAVLFRLVQAHTPTVLADECDSWLRDNEELRGMLNSGHRRGGKSYRCHGDSHAVRAFDVFAPVVLCGIGALPGTLHDRSIEIRLKRAKAGEIRKRFNSRQTQSEQELCRKLARFCADSRAALEICDPILPPAAFNRLADNWRPLFAIAEVAGGDWPKRAANAFAKLVGKQKDADAQGIGPMLLQDIQHAFNEANAGRIFSKHLIKLLCAMTDRPWPEANRDKPITETWLGRHLRPFEISPRTVRIGDERAKGYELVQFADAFERYLPSEGLIKRDSVTMPKNADDSQFSKRDKLEACHGCETHESHESIDLSRCHASNSTTASVPFMITRQMENDLRSFGYSANEINKLTPWQAGAILKRRQRSPKATRSAPMIHGEGWIAA